MSSAAPPRLPLAHRVSPIEIVCHRGALQYAPENTIASAEHSISCGADYIELDIHMSADQEYFVIHDATVNRTTNGTGAVAEISAARLDSLDAGSWFSADFAGERLLRFRTFLQTVRGRSKLFVDFKAGVPAEIIRLIGEAGMARDFSFGPKKLNSSIFRNAPILICESWHGLWIMLRSTKRKHATEPPSLRRGWTNSRQSWLEPVMKERWIS